MFLECLRVMSAKLAKYNYLVCCAATALLAIAAAASGEPAPLGKTQAPGISKTHPSGTGSASSTNEHPSNMIDGAMSFGAREVAQLSGILPPYQLLLHEQEKALLNHQTDNALQEIKRRQRILYLHVKINQFSVETNSEILSTIARLDSEITQLDDLRALISDERTRSQHRTSIVNMFSGGMTKIGGYTSALTAVTLPGLIPTNVLEIFDGVVQTGLSSMMLRQAHHESSLCRMTPGMLISFLTTSQLRPQAYPQSVWAYLTHPFPDSQNRISRRQLLIEVWSSTGKVIRSTNATSGGASHIVLSRSARSNPDIIRVMLTDIKSVVSSMENNFSELTSTLQGTYVHDPEF